LRKLCNYYYPYREMNAKQKFKIPTIFPAPLRGHCYVKIQTSLRRGGDSACGDSATLSTLRTLRTLNGAKFSAMKF